MGRNSLTSGDGTSLVERHLNTTLRNLNVLIRIPRRLLRPPLGEYRLKNSAFFPNVLMGRHMITKICKHCKEQKTLGEFFSEPYGGRAAQHGTSMFCKQCHSEGKIKYGYGWYGDKHKSPDDTIKMFDTLHDTKYNQYMTSYKGV